MAEPLKSFFSAALVERLGQSVRRVYPSFEHAAFRRRASRGLDGLELMGRARHIADALGAHLPERYPEGIEILLASIGPEHARDELQGAGMGPFFYMPHLVYVAERGLDHFELSMRAQYELTKRFTAEFSIRSFLDRYPRETLRVLKDWTADPSPHVRRLASEGTRLRLPWGSRVGYLDDHPDEVVALLERLKDDPTPLVRRSVANNLNDLTKVHPGLALDTCARWLVRATPERRALVEHALRSAIKRGVPRALELVGYGGAPRVELASCRFEPRGVAIGGDVAVALTLRSTARRSQSLLVDLRVHFVKAVAGKGAKVFKVARVELAPDDEVTLSKRVSLRVHTTRAPRPGRHAVEVLVNGVAFDAGAFTVVASR